MADRFVIADLSTIQISLEDNESVLNPFSNLIQRLIEKSWCKETSASPDHWTPDNPAFGQCAVTALLFEDLVGGMIVKTNIKDFGSHYWNAIMHHPDDVTVYYDLTRRQFPSDLKITGLMTAHRNDILRSERAKQLRTPERYQLLRQRFLQFMSEELHQRIDQ